MKLQYIAYRYLFPWCRYRSMHYFCRSVPIPPTRSSICDLIPRGASEHLCKEFETTITASTATTCCSSAILGGTVDREFCRFATTIVSASTGGTVLITGMQTHTLDMIQLVMQGSHCDTILRRTTFEDTHRFLDDLLYLIFIGISLDTHV